jgi:hypothetical protein
MLLRLSFTVALAVFVLGSAAPLPQKPDMDKEVEQKLLLAFGQDHKGVRDAKFKFTVKTGDQVFACDTFEIEEDGWVKITPGYWAWFEDSEGVKAKKRLGRKYEAAWIRMKMEPPVKGVSDVARSRVNGMELFKTKTDDFGRQ